MPNPIPNLEAITATDLLTQPIEPLAFTIDAILPHGLFILAGSSKIGKSWLALDMSCAVASGGSLWQYPATRGDVLYLALEDNHKSDDADPVNRVVGSTGLTGAVDGIFVLEKNKRVGDSAKLTIANRDTEGHQFDLRFDRQNCRWQFVAEAHTEDDSDDTLYLLLECLLDEAPIWNGTATQLCAALKLRDFEFSLSPITVARTLKNRHEFLKTRYGIECSFTRSKTARIIEFSRDVIMVDYENTNREPFGLVV